METKNKNTLKHLAILLFCPPCLSMTLLAIAIGAPLDVILWMASGPLLIMGVAAFVVILDRHAIWGLTREQPKTNVWRRATNVWRRLTSPARGGKAIKPRIPPVFARATARSRPSSDTRGCELRNLQRLVPTGYPSVCPQYFARFRSRLANYQMFPL
jgi:hypothetical protein